METDNPNIRNDSAYFQFPVISSDYLDSRRVFNNHKMVYIRHDFKLGPFYVKLTALRIRRNKKIKLDIMGTFAYVDGEEGIKLIIPTVSNILIHGVEEDYTLRHQYNYILGGNYGSEVLLKNPRMIRHTNLIVCDIEYKNGGNL